MEKSLKDWTPLKIHLSEDFRAIIWTYTCGFVYEYFPNILSFKPFDLGELYLYRTKKNLDSLKKKES